MTPSLRMSRRVFFRGTAVLLGTAALAACSGRPHPTPRGYDGAPRPLPIPPIDEGSVDGRLRTFTLSTQAGESPSSPTAPPPPPGVSTGRTSARPSAPAGVTISASTSPTTSTR